MADGNAPLPAGLLPVPLRPEHGAAAAAAARGACHVLQLEHLSDHFAADQLFAGTAIPRMPREISGPARRACTVERRRELVRVFAAMRASIAPAADRSALRVPPRRPPSSPITRDPACGGRIEPALMIRRVSKPRARSSPLPNPHDARRPDLRAGFDRRGTARASVDAGASPTRSSAARAREPVARRRRQRAEERPRDGRRRVHAGSDARQRPARRRHQRAEERPRRQAAAAGLRHPAAAAGGSATTSAGGGTFARPRPRREQHAPSPPAATFATTRAASSAAPRPPPRRPIPATRERAVPGSRAAAASRALAVGRAEPRRSASPAAAAARAAAITAASAL